MTFKLRPEYDEEFNWVKSGKKEMQAEGVLNVKLNKLEQTIVGAVNTKSKLKQSAESILKHISDVGNILSCTKWLFNF